MAKNISLLGADYPAVPAVVLPQTGGGQATFIEQGEIEQTLSDLYVLPPDNELDTGVVVNENDTTLKRIRIRNTSLSMAYDTWVKLGSLPSSSNWIHNFRGFFRVATNLNKCFFDGYHFHVRWDIDTGNVFVLQLYSSQTITVNATLYIDYE